MCYSKLALHGEKKLETVWTKQYVDLVFKKHWLVTEKKKKITS